MYVVPMIFRDKVVTSFESAAEYIHDLDDVVDYF